MAGSKIKTDNGCPAQAQIVESIVFASVAWLYSATLNLGKAGGSGEGWEESVMNWARLGAFVSMILLYLIITLCRRFYCSHFADEENKNQSPRFECVWVKPVIHDPWLTRRIFKASHLSVYGIFCQVLLPQFQGAEVIREGQKWLHFQFLIFLFPLSLSSLISPFKIISSSTFPFQISSWPMHHFLF